MSNPFEATPTDGAARAGILRTAHGDVLTPAFMPVGTKATVKTVDPDELRSLGATILLGNAYHLHFRPGEDLIAELGGLHRFMGWDGPILTDSGGYQVYSLAASRQITDHAAFFRSHIDGSPFELTPERAVAIQENLGSDIASTSARPQRSTAPRSRRPSGARRSGPRASSRRRARKDSCCSGSRRAPRTPSCAGVRSRSSVSSTSTATPSAGLRSARRAT